MPMTTALPRVLLIEDDASLRRFVGIVLEDLPLELVACESAAQALTVLTHSPVDLILTDLMMPGESGLELLERFKANPALRGSAKVVVLSAGLTPAIQALLESLLVWETLHKPVSVAALAQCVTRALALPDAHPAPSTCPDDQETPAPTKTSPQDDAVQVYFVGNVELFTAYHAQCLSQFHDDIRAGDTATQCGDLPALQRLAHSLKTVFQTLGYPLLSTQARALEDLSGHGNTGAAQAGWVALRDKLQALAQGY
jgi:CheY-like chemotaxis protein/HPt (histidine-containing phosphotransfer) domain-containing protein